MSEKITMFNIEMTKEQKDDLQKRIHDINMTPSEYLRMLTIFFDVFTSEIHLTKFKTLDTIKTELVNQKEIISEQWNFVNELKGELNKLKTNKPPH